MDGDSPMSKQQPYDFDEWCRRHGVTPRILENARRRLLADWQAELEQRRAIVARGGKADVKGAEEQVAYYTRILRGVDER